MPLQFLLQKLIMMTHKSVYWNRRRTIHSLM